MLLTVIFVAAFPSLTATAVLLLCPALWRESFAVLASAAALAIYLAVRLGFHSPSSFDAQADAFEGIDEVFTVVGILSVAHLIYLGVLIHSLITLIRRHVVREEDRGEV
jgi:hypothetical protein